MKSFAWLYGVALAWTSEAANVRENGGNCDGLKSCRPRCITFRIDRDNQECDSSEGIFSVESVMNPWDVPEFKTFNCEPICDNNLCGLDLFGDLTVRIGEFGESGSQYYSNIFLPGDNEERFTYCSVYPCPKEECAVPEQMVSARPMFLCPIRTPTYSHRLTISTPQGARLQFDFLQGVVQLDEEKDYALRLVS